MIWQEPINNKADLPNKQKSKNSKLSEISTRHRKLRFFLLFGIPSKYQMKQLKN